MMSLNPNKAHGHDRKDVKSCTTSVVKPLWIISKNCSDNECLSLTWKNPIVVPNE